MRPTTPTKSVLSRWDSTAMTANPADDSRCWRSRIGGTRTEKAHVSIGQPSDRATKAAAYRRSDSARSNAKCMHRRTRAVISWPSRQRNRATRVLEVLSRHCRQQQKQSMVRGQIKGAIDLPVHRMIITPPVFRFITVGPLWIPWPTVFRRRDFSRGSIPFVRNPTRCAHDHSKVNFEHGRNLLGA